MLLCFFMLIKRAWQWSLAWACKEQKAMRKLQFKSQFCYNCRKHHERSYVYKDFIKQWYVYIYIYIYFTQPDLTPTF